MPAVPTVSFADNADGTGTVSVSGSDAGATNAVQVLAIDNQWPSSDWSLSASRTGDGDVNIATGAGIFWLSVRSTLSGNSSWSIPQYVTVTDGAVPVETQIVDAVVARIRLLGLTGITSARVFGQILLTPDFVKNMKGGDAVLVAPWDGESLIPGGPTNRDYYSYPIVIALVANANQSDSNVDRWRKWRQLIRHAFATQALVTPSAQIYSADYLKISGLIREYWNRNLGASLLGFSFKSRELRGMGV